MLFYTVGYTQDKDKILSVKDMHADIDFYLSSLQDVHPNPFTVLTTEEFKTKTDSIKNTITQPLSKKEFYLIISSMNKYTDLHTRIVPSKKMVKQKDSYFQLPVFTRTEDGVFFSLKNSVKYQLTAINGMDIQAIDSFFLSRRNLVEVNNTYNFLDELNYCKNHYFWEGRLVFSYINDNNQQDTLTIYSVKPDKKKSDKAQQAKGERICNLIYDSVQSTAVFELNTFLPQTFKGKMNFTKNVNSVFDTLKAKKIKRLYIDLTCNGGGLIAFEEFLLNYFITDNRSLVLWDLTWKQSPQRRKQRGNIAFVADGNFYQQSRQFNPSDISNKFTGEVYVIQSRSSFSAASTLASQLRKFTSAKIIGEECQIKAVYTDPVVLEFPHSKLRFSCATGFIKNVGGAKTRGVIPDIPYNIYNIYDPVSIQEAEKMRMSHGG